MLAVPSTYDHRTLKIDFLGPSAMCSMLWKWALATIAGYRILKTVFGFQFGVHLNYAPPGHNLGRGHFGDLPTQPARE
jgi:hypothetical protein